MSGLKIESVSSLVIGQSEFYEPISDMVFFDRLGNRLCILTGNSDQAFLITIPSA